MAAQKNIDLKTAMPFTGTDLLQSIIEAGLVSDWTSAEIFSERTGVSVTTLKNKHKIWPEGVVWQKALDGRLYYSIKGFNRWMDQQAAQKCQPAFGCDQVALKSTSAGMGGANTSRSRSQQHQQTSSKPQRLALK